MRLAPAPLQFRGRGALPARGRQDARVAAALRKRTRGICLGGGELAKLNSARRCPRAYE